MPFEPQGSPFIAGGVDAFVVLDPGFTPSTIIRRNQTCRLRTNWHINGLLALGLGGSWTVKAFLESMGPGAEVQVGSETIPLSAGTPSADRKDFKSEIVVAAGSMPAGVYKLVVAITYTEPGGTPGPLAAYQEGPILQFFEP